MRFALRIMLSVVVTMAVGTVAGVTKAREVSSYYSVALNSVDDSWLTSVCNATVNAPAYSALRATATSVGPDERFTLWDLNDGSLIDGDEVIFQCDGQRSHDYYALAPWAGETPIYFSEPTANGVQPQADHWYLYDTDCTTSGCVVQDGHKLHFQNKVTGKYLYAVNGGGGNVNADASSASSYARFEIVFQ